jgi:GntR family transcriptional repressor for pyruvate dehydrogenase complex
MEPATRQVTFEAFEKDILPNKIVSSLLTLIKDKELLPGDKLPPERELAEMMNVSRSALREALRALAVMNVVEIRPGSGTFITTLSPEQLVAPLTFMFALDDATIFQLFEARETLELRKAALAAQHNLQHVEGNLRPLMCK